MTKKPLIVLTNDDGIKSPGLRAAARAVMNLGELLIAAPREQQSSTGRAFLGMGDAEPFHYVIDGKSIRAFAVPTSPAVTMRHAFLLLADRPPALVISGINYGENIGNGVTISGTIGAALEAANLGAPAIAMSVVAMPEFHLTHSEQIDFSIAAHFARYFAKRIIARGLPRGVDVLNVNVPEDARRSTEWRWTRVSRAAYYHSRVEETTQALEPDSDVRAVILDHVVSVSPLTLDLTARVSRQERARWIT
ncbi:MAG: 5'/3'-nucleotidase SurE [Chloroflexi bacterium]|nr:5'/3'-nucleotidase SurE [Chloroflexota bacterium]